MSTGCCDYPKCQEDKVCFYYCAEHHAHVCVNGNSYIHNDPVDDILDVPIEELEADLCATKEDLNWCLLFLALPDVSEENKVSIQERLKGNREMDMIIENELARRKFLETM